MGRRRTTLIRDPPIRRRVGIGRRGTIIPSLDPITRRRGRGLSDRPPAPALARPPPIPISARPQPVGLRPRRPKGKSKLVQVGFKNGRPVFDRIPIGRPRPRPQLGGDFNVLQPFGRPRPTRVEVAQPSGREGRLITVSSRSILARGRKKKKVRGRKAKVERVRLSPPPVPPRRQPPVFEFMPFQEISFGEGRRREGRRGEFEEREERPRRRRAPPRRRRSDDFGLGNIFDVQF